MNPTIAQEFGSDKFCWHCDKECKGFDVRFNCSTCFRFFHAKCLTELKENDYMNGFICSICKAYNKAKDDNSVEKQTISRLLRYQMDAILRDDKYQFINNDTMVNAVNLNEISRKIDSQLYDNFYAFLVDILCIQHYYKSTRELPHYFGLRQSHADTISMLVQWCKSEIDHASLCAECYEKKYTQPSEWHKFTCNKLHLVLCVKLNEFVAKTTGLQSDLVHFAKLLELNSNVAKVILFDRSELFEVPKKNCFLFTSEAQLPLIQAQGRTFSASLKAALSHLDDTRRKFPNFLQELAKAKAIFSEYSDSSLCDLNSADKPNQPDESKDSETEDSESDSSTESDDYDTSELSEISKDGDVIERKRRRLSGQCSLEDFENETTLNPMPVSSIIVTNGMRDAQQQLIQLDEAIEFCDAIEGQSDFNGSNLNRNNDSPGESTIQKELRETIEHMERIQNMAMNYENVNNSMIQELETLKRSQAEFQTKNDKLLRQFIAVLFERDTMKNEIAKMQEVHAEELRVLTELRDSTENEAEENSDDIGNTDEENDDKTDKTIENSDATENITVAAQDSSEKVNLLAKEFTEAIAMVFERGKQNAIEERDEELKKNREYIEQMETEIEFLKAALGLTKLDLESEKKRFEKLKIEHDKKVNELEQKVKVANEEKVDVERKLQQKYEQIVSQIKIECESFCGSIDE